MGDKKLSHHNVFFNGRFCAIFEKGEDPIAWGVTGHDGRGALMSRNSHVLSHWHA
jgi:hypothetical protein